MPNRTRSDQVLSFTSPTVTASPSADQKTNQSSKVAATTATLDAITPSKESEVNLFPPKEGTIMDEESIAIVSTDASDASISSLSGGTVSTSSSISSLLDTGAFTSNNEAEVARDDNKKNVTFADIDKTPVSYELSTSMYHGLLESCRPFYFPSEQQVKPNTSQKSNLTPLLEDALLLKRKMASSLSIGSTRSNTSTQIFPLSDNEKRGGRKVYSKTISFHEPTEDVPRKKARR
mmetsp:Transcript_23283/g.55007  ORF Transcript_23283/g.55007 Transcript_23283/m.55007 type:complete len:234 (+) Transcript_23283:74-775(+)